jgi:hypothetical protein
MNFGAPMWRSRAIADKCHSVISRRGLAQKRKAAHRIESVKSPAVDSARRVRIGRQFAIKLTQFALTLLSDPQ